MNILFVFYVPSGGVETLNRQRGRALKKYNINSHFLYYEKRRQLVNDHNAPTFITNNDAKIKKSYKQEITVLLLSFQIFKHCRGSESWVIKEK